MLHVVICSSEFRFTRQVRIVSKVDVDVADVLAILRAAIPMIAVSDNNDNDDDHKFGDENAGSGRVIPTIRAAIPMIAVCSYVAQPVVACSTCAV